MKNSLGNFNVKTPGKYLGTRVSQFVNAEGGALITDVYYYDNVIVRNIAPKNEKPEAMLYSNGYRIETIRKFINSALEQFGYSTRIELIPDTNIWVVNGLPFAEGMLVNG